MFFFKRAILYLSRKKGKTLILFLLTFIVSTFVLSGFSVLYAAEEAAENMRIKVGAAFHIRPFGRDVWMQESNEDNDVRSVITKEAIQEIMKESNIKYYNGRSTGYAKGLRFLPGAFDTDENNMGQIVANHYSVLHSNFQESILEVIDGRHITPADENVVLISETLAALNELHVGDYVVLFPAEPAWEEGRYVNALQDDKTAVNARIIGVFKELELQKNAAYQPTAALRTNLIYSDHTFLVNLGLAQEGEYTGGASFYITDPLDLDAVVSKVRQSDLIDWQNFLIRKDDYNYEKISAELQTIQNLVRMLIICVSAVSALVLLLILMMRMRGRVREAGILMSVGIAKKEILGQFAVEATVIAVSAFVCSWFVAGLISDRVESGILDNLQAVRIEELALQTGMAGNQVSSVQIAMPVGIVLLIYICLLTVMIAVTCMSALPILKMRPGEILSKIS